MSTALHSSVTAAFLAVMRAKHPTLLWSVSPPAKPNPVPDRRSLAA